MAELADTCVTSFGVGTSIANAPTLDLSMDIVEKDGVPMSKRGKFGGRKFAYRCPDCLSMDVSLSPNDDIRCSCGGHMEMVEQCVLKNGKRQLPESDTRAADGTVDSPRSTRSKTWHLPTVRASYLMSAVTTAMLSIFRKG